MTENTEAVRDDNHRSERWKNVRPEVRDLMDGLFPLPPRLSENGILLRPLESGDAADLERLTESEAVYRYLPSFLYEKKYPDIHRVISGLYTEGLKESLILGVFQEGLFRGLAEVYGYRAPINKVSVGYRFLEEAWGRGLATSALRMLIDELLNVRKIEIITASTMTENHASARVLQKNGFILVNHAVDEDWGFPDPTPADKWIL